MTVPNSIPLFPTLSELASIRLVDYPKLSQFFDTGPDWRKQHWDWGVDFLKYIGRNKSEHTYNCFRSEVERFLIWAFLSKATPIDTYRKSDILE